MNIKSVAGLVIAAVVLIGVVVFFTRSVSPAPSVHTNTQGGTVIQIVAAENFWGSLASEIGGMHVHVLSIVTDPNADPHEYASNTSDARAITDANYVIVNGAGYDSWITKLLNAGNNPHRTVFTVADFLGKKQGDNPHFWYSPDYVRQVSAKIEQDLIIADPADTVYFQQQYASLQAGLAGYQNQIAKIKTQFGGTPVGATEDIFVYLSDATGLNLISPPAFILAVGEGNDPPAASVVQFQNQLENKQIKILVYNEQTNTPVTERMKQIAIAHTIPVVGITETMIPLNGTFQDWMSSEMTALESALAKAKGM
jgi:zinc/manganese transport system substrate-binding protein